MKRQDAEMASVVCEKTGSNERPLSGVVARLFVALTVACAALGGVAAAQETADPAQAEPPAEAPAEASPAPEAEAGEGGATPAAPETEADEEAQPEQGEMQGEPESEPIRPEGEAEEPARPGRWIRGSFTAGVDALWSDEDEDIDLDQTIRLRIDPPQYPNLHFRGALWLQEDLDSDDAYYNAAVRDFDDVTDSDVRASLLYLYAQIDDLWGDSELRIGRQRIEQSPLYNRIDGLHFRQRLEGWEWYLFGGARASNYYDTHSDEVLGGGLAFQLTPVTRIALDGFYGDEDRDEDIYVHPVYRFFDLEFPRRVHENVDDNYFSLSLWQWFAPNVSLFGRFGLQNGEADDLVLSVNGQYPKWDVAYEVTYHGQLNENGDQVNDLTAFYRILGELEKYDDVLVAVHKPLNKILTLSIEGQWHDSAAGEDEAWSNRDFQRYAVILAADELVPTVDATLALEYWDVDEGEGTWAVTGEVSKTWERLKLTLGADYERYEDRVIEYNPWAYVADRAFTAFVPAARGRYNPLLFVFDTYAVEMHEDIYSFYTELEYDLAKDQQLDLRVTYEEDDGPESPYWRVQAGYTINF